ncbi:MAG: hypothetical protein B7X02_01690 [Rhodospirillales bacterium 12-54-5]|nr:MAG: hypothetical protein B7X02_01690 [Rhodospirillales bacterium 12-54-5]
MSLAPSTRTRALFMLLLALTTAACGLKSDENTSYPIDDKDERRARVGKLSGDEGIVVAGAATKKNDSANNPLSVNSFLWRATLDTLAFMPLLSADPWGGTILTDWYEDPKARGERFKVNALILDKQLRADNIKITTFRQKKTAKGAWEDAAVDPSTGRKLEDAVLTRARQLRVKQLGY